MIRTINNIFIFSEWCDCVVSFHFKELKELSNHLVVDEDETDFDADDSYGNTISSLQLQNRRLDECCDNITNGEVAFDGEFVVCVVEEVFLTPEECAAHRVVLMASITSSGVCSTKTLLNLSAPMMVS